MTECTGETKCIICQGAHMANSRGCPHYRFRCEILATQTHEHITYREAEETVRTRFMEDRKTYSFVTGRTNKIQSADNTEKVGCHENKYQQRLNFRAKLFLIAITDCDTSIVNEDDTGTTEIFVIDIGDGRGSGRGQGGSSSRGRDSQGGVEEVAVALKGASKGRAQMDRGKWFLISLLKGIN